MQMFSLDNRLGLDLKKIKEEKQAGRECVLFSFLTFPDLSTVRLQMLDQWVGLRQQGEVWVDAANFQLVRITGQQLKLPKNWRSYKYEVEFSPLPDLGPKVFLPIHVGVKVEMKDRSYQVDQTYSKFELLHK
jgi:hypothetical protein